MYGLINELEDSGKAKAIGIGLLRLLWIIFN